MDPSSEFEVVSKCGSLIVYHLEDEAIVHCIDNCLLELAAARQVRDLLLVGVSNDSTSDELEAVVLFAGQKKQGKLWSLFRDRI